MAKRVFLFLALILLLSFTSASRPGPVHPAQYPQHTQEQVVDVENMDVAESCDGIGEEECLMRRTLAAHVDYIYTQKHKNP